jgi:hypothetical protein
MEGLGHLQAFSRPFGTTRTVCDYPGLTSWAKSSRPFGTRMVFFAVWRGVFRCL